MFVLQAGWCVESGKTLIGVYDRQEAAVNYIKANGPTGFLFDEYIITEMEINTARLLSRHVWRRHNGSYHKFINIEEWKKEHGELTYRLD